MSEAAAQLFLAIPRNGSWMRGRGPHSATLIGLLDAGCPYFEENAMPDDNRDVERLVRLTVAGKGIVDTVIDSYLASPSGHITSNIQDLLPAAPQTHEAGKPML